MPVMRDKIQRERASEPPYVGLEKQARRHTSGSKPNYRDMPADVSVKEPSKGSFAVVSRNHRTESSNSADEHEATEYFNKTTTSDSSTSTIMAGLTEQPSILLFFLPILTISKQVAGN